MVHIAVALYKRCGIDQNAICSSVPANVSLNL